MSLFFEKPGIFSSIQDLGRPGFRRFGINPGGAMDTFAARTANLLLGNDEKAPLIEMYFPAAEITFEDDVIGAITGADFQASINGALLPNWSSFNIKAGDRLRFTGRSSGNICYLAVSGGLEASDWLAVVPRVSRLASADITGGRFAAGDCVAFASPQTAADRSRPRRVSPKIMPLYRPFPTVRVLRGAEFDRCTPASQASFLSDTFVISTESDRMGFRLDGRRLELDEPVEMISTAVTFGTIQLLPNGKLIVLMADHQTVGGYPRIGQVITSDLPLIAQLAPQDKVAFHEVTLKEAEEIHIKYETNLAFMKVAGKS